MGVRKQVLTKLIDRVFKIKCDKRFDPFPPTQTHGEPSGLRCVSHGGNRHLVLPAKNVRTLETTENRSPHGPMLKMDLFLGIESAIHII